MVNVKGYISLNFTKAFLTIFLPFYLIISLIYFVRIAAFTAKIQISFGELFLLYSYSIPDILFYTLPLSFITALANVLIKLSQDNELIALYALGLKAKTVLHSLVLLALLFSFLLLTISLLAMPLSKQMYKSFKNEKRSEAKLNITAGKLGQKFEDFYVYVEEKEGEIFHNIVIYNRSDKTNEQFFAAQTGQLNDKYSAVSLLLNDGYGYTYSDTTLEQVEYESLEVYDRVYRLDFKFEDLRTYWNNAASNIKLMQNLLFTIFVSLIPLLSVYLVASFTMINPRYQANRSYIVIFITTMSLYVIASILNKWGNPFTLILSVILVAILGQWLFSKRVSRYF